MKFPHVAIYSRVSTAVQVEEGMSLESQPVMARQKLDDVFGKGRYTCVEFSDEGKSGGTGPKPWAIERKARDRKGLWEMLLRLKAGEFTHIAAFRLDRIYRDQLGCMALYSEIMKPKGIEFVLVADRFDTSNEGLFTQGVLAGVAELQRHQISDNIKRNLDLKRTQGYYLGTIPFGWKRQESRDVPGFKPNIEPEANEKEVIIRIKEMYLSGMSENAIAIALNTMGTAHKKSAGRWRANTVHLVLINPTHAGLVRQPDGSLKEGIHWESRFYEPSDLSLIHARLERNRKRLKGVDHTQPFRLFSGLSYCGHCGKKLQGSFHNESPGYRCLGKGIANDGSHVYVSAKTLERLIVGQLEEYALSPAVISQIENEIEAIIRAQDTELQTRAIQLRAALDDVEKKADAIAEAIACRAISYIQARKKSDELEQTRLRLMSELNEIAKILEASSDRSDQVANAKKALRRFTNVWETLGDSEKREALHLVTERIDVFATSERKWLSAKFVFKDAPIEIDILRGAERYRQGKLDGIASLTPRELAALKHYLDGANYVLIAKYFDSTPTNAHALLRSAASRLGASSVSEAAKMAETFIRRIECQLPLFGKSDRAKHSPKRLKVMQYQILILASEGYTSTEIAVRTGIDENRASQLLQSAISLLECKTAKEAIKRVRANDELLPISMHNRKRIG